MRGSKNSEEEDIKRHHILSLKKKKKKIGADFHAAIAQQPSPSK
jgi:hypothetical protein